MSWVRWLAAYALLLALLTGCRPTLRVVEVPVAVPCPAPEPLPEPEWRYPRLATDATMRERAQAMADDFAAAVAWGRALEALLEGLRGP